MPLTLHIFVKRKKPMKTFNSHLNVFNRVVTCRQINIFSFSACCNKNNLDKEVYEKLYVHQTVQKSLSLKLFVLSSPLNDDLRKRLLIQLIKTGITFCQANCVLLDYGKNMLYTYLKM